MKDKKYLIIQGRDSLTKREQTIYAGEGDLSHWQEKLHRQPDQAFYRLTEFEVKAGRFDESPEFYVRVTNYNVYASNGYAFTHVERSHAGFPFDTRVRELFSKILKNARNQAKARRR